MTEFEEYQEHIQHTHNAFCGIVIRHASIDAARKLYSKWKREISLEYLSEEKFMPFAATDEYFAKPPSSEEFVNEKRILLFWRKRLFVPTIKCIWSALFNYFMCTFLFGWKSGINHA